MSSLQFFLYEYWLLPVGTLVILGRAWELHRYCSHNINCLQRYGESYATFVILVDETSISKALSLAHDTSTDFTQQKKSDLKVGEFFLPTMVVNLCL